MTWTTPLQWNGEQSTRLSKQTSSGELFIIQWNDDEKGWPELHLEAGEKTSLEKYNSNNTKLWWRKFVHRLKMTKNSDKSTISNSRKVTPQNHELLEWEIKDIFLWAFGQNAITETTKTVSEKKISFHYTTYIQGSHTQHTGKKCTT